MAGMYASIADAQATMKRGLWTITSVAYIACWYLTLNE